MSIKGSDPTDETLLAGYALGDKSSFEMFFSRHWKRVRAYGIKMGLSPESADDLVQISFEKLHQSVTRFDPTKSGALQWFFAIVHNACMDQFRAKRLEQMQTQKLAQKQLDAEVPEVPVKEALDLNLALASLTDHERQLIDWRCQEELSFSEIKIRTGESEVRLRKQWSRLLKKLRFQNSEGDEN